MNNNEEEQEFVSAFADFDLDEKAGPDEQTKPRRQRIPSDQAPENVAPLKPFKQTDSWFFGAETYNHEMEDILYFRGNNLFASGEFLRAYQTFMEAMALKQDKKFLIPDSLLRSMIKGNISMDEVQKHLERVGRLMRTRGEQAQHWELIASFSLSTQPQQLTRYLRMMALLCKSFDWSSLWLRLDIPEVKSDSNLKLGSLCRAMSLMKRESASAHGFVRERLERKRAALEERIKREYPIERVEVAIKHCCAGLVDRSDAGEMFGTDDRLKPVHLSRPELPLRTQEEKEEMLRSFVQGEFAWLFEDQPLLAEEILVVAVE